MTHRAVACSSVSAWVSETRWPKPECLTACSLASGLLGAVLESLGQLAVKIKRHKNGRCIVFSGLLTSRWKLYHSSGNLSTTKKGPFLHVLFSKNICLTSPIREHLQNAGKRWKTLENAGKRWKVRGFPGKPRKTLLKNPYLPRFFFSAPRNPFKGS
jgi:hypothetical protein